MVSFERLASSPVGNAQFPLFWRIKEPQKGIFLSSTWESGQILPQKVDGQKLLYLYLNDTLGLTLSTPGLVTSLFEVLSRQTELI